MPPESLLKAWLAQKIKKVFYASFCKINHVSPGVIDTITDICFYSALENQATIVAHFTRRLY